MSYTFGQTIQDYSGDKVARLRQGWISRKPLPALMAPGAWTTMRVAIRASMFAWTSLGVDMVLTPRLAIGLSAGPLTGQIGKGSVTHFVGAVTNDATWTAAAAGNARFNIDTFSSAVQVGASLTLGSDTLGAADMILNCTGGGTGVIKLFFVDITRGSPWTVNVKLYPDTNNTTDATAANFTAQYNQAVPALANHVAGSAQNITVDESTNGIFTHACVSWDKVHPYFDIFDWAVFKVA